MSIPAGPMRKFEFVRNGTHGFEVQNPDGSKTNVRIQGTIGKVVELDELQAAEARRIGLIVAYEPKAEAPASAPAAKPPGLARKVR